MATFQQLNPGGTESSTLAGTPFGTLDAYPIYIKKKMLSISKKKVVFHQLGDSETLPEGMGKTVRWIRYDRFGAPFLPLTEGVSPTDYRQLVPTKIECTVDQWGDVGVLTDVSELTIFHKPLQIMIDRFATQAAETIDREDQRVLMAGTNITFPDPSYTSRDQLTTSDFINTDTIRRVLAALRNEGAPDFSGDFVGVFDPYVELDLMKDPTFQTAAAYSNITPLMNGEVGRWMGVRWMRSNFIPAIVRNTAVVVTTGGSGGSPAAAGAETALPTAASYDVTLTGLDKAGFETQIGTIVNIGFTAGDILEVITPALPTGVFAYRLYVGPVGGTRVLVGDGLLPATTYRVTGNGLSNTSATGLAYSAGVGLVAPVLPGVNVKVHQTYIFGKEAFGVVDFQNVETTLTPPVASDSDPLKQRRKAGWKAMYKAVIKNPNYFRRIESESYFD